MWDKLKKFVNRFFLINDTPAKIAGGAAMGIFLGIVPGEGVLTTLILASLFSLNRMAALAGVLATNMWTTLIILPFAAMVGGLLFDVNPDYEIYEFNQIYHLGIKFFLSKIILLDIVFPLVIGFFLVAGAIALGFFFLIYFPLRNRNITLRSEIRKPRLFKKK